MRETAVRVCVLLLFSTASAHAGVISGGTITDGDVSFTRTNVSFDNSPHADLKGVSSTLTTDHLFEFGWWYRVNADTQELPLGSPNAESYVADTSHLTWADVGVRGLISADEVAVVQDAGATSSGDGGWVLFRMTVTNISGSPLTLDLYAYGDFDIGATSGNDSGTLVTSGKVRELLSVEGTNHAEFATYLSEAYQVSIFSTVRGLLTDAAVTDFNDTGLPFGPGDMTAGEQWKDEPLAAGESRTYIAILAVNSYVGCTSGTGNSVFCNGFELRANPFWTEITPRACSGLCGSANSPGDNCFCDSLCLSKGDCCLDACLTCGLCPAL